MALKNINKFNWEKLLAKTENAADMKRKLLMLRGKANEITANVTKYDKAPAAIDFDSYKKKLKFTSPAVAALEKIYKNTALPKYTSDLPALEAKRRAALLEVAKSVVSNVNKDLDALNNQLDSFESSRITRDTSVGEMKTRFPHIAKEVEAEIKNHQWLKDSV